MAEHPTPAVDDPGAVTTVPGVALTRQTFVHVPGVEFAFTGRGGGVSTGPFATLNLAHHVGDDAAAVDRNRALVAAGLDLPPDHLVWMSQVHGRDVAVARAPGEPAAKADALVTAVPGLALAVMVADCTPLLLADPVARLVAAVHVGRAGLVRGVVPAAVARLTALGAQPERLHAVTGPAICGACYEVPPALRDEVTAAVPEAWAVTRTGTAAVDVTTGVWAQLGRLGVRPGHRSPVCSLESDEHFSYRRAARTGRFAGFVRLVG